MERSLVIIKPDGVQRGLIGETLARFEKRGLKIVALKLMLIDRPLAERHYAVHKGKFFYEGLINYITSCPVVVALVEGPEAIKVLRAMVGATRPSEAASGTIRGDYALQGLRNLIHASDSPETAQYETGLFFTPPEILPYARDVDRWIYES